MTTIEQPPPPPEAGGAQDPLAPAAPPQAQLPPTGVQQQVGTINAGQPPPGQVPPGVAQPQPGGVGTTSLGNLAQQLAQSYGLPIGKGGLVDEQGNFLMTPDQLAAASGGQETMGSAAAKMNYISQAITQEQNRRQQQKGIAAIQTGLGLVQERGRGSLAAMQSGFYQDLADLYSNQEYEAADYSYFIQKEQLDIQQSIARDLRKAAEKKSKFGGIGGAIGAIAGGLTGIPGLSVAGAGLGEAISGWF
jgi:hypothetical protein